MNATSIGPIMQMAYIVPDLDAAIQQWATQMGVGPFAIQRAIEYDVASLDGQNTDLVIDAAFAFWGDMNIELIEQKNDAPSVFREFVERNGYGLQHVGVMSHDIEGDTQKLAERGIAMRSRLLARSGVETRYFATEFLPGTLLELICATPDINAAFAGLKQAAIHWDGVHPTIG